jgi:amino acid transporter
MATSATFFATRTGRNWIIIAPLPFRKAFSPREQEIVMAEVTQAELKQHFGLLQSTALNITMVVGAGVFVTIPLMLAHLPGPLALLGWVAAGFLILLDGMIWSELGAALPGSGGSCRYLLEGYGKKSWGKVMAFLFVWQFMLSGPLEVASGLIAMSQFASAIHPDIAAWNEKFTYKVILFPQADLAWTISPARLFAFAMGCFLLVLLYRRVEVLGKVTLLFSLGVIGIIVWIILDGSVHFQWQHAFDLKPDELPAAGALATGLGQAMILAMYSYLGYYNICYVGDEVKEPGKNIPRSIFLCSITVIILFIGAHLAMTGVVGWRNIPTWRGRRHFDDHISGVELPGGSIRRVAGVFPSAFWGSPAGLLFQGHGKGALPSPYSTSIFAYGRRNDFVLVFLRSGFCHHGTDHH